MRSKLESVWEKTGVMIIDGSMSTALEQLGCDLNDSLWTATALVRSPELIKQVHTDYFKAGADCGITCSYQATIPGLMEKGFSQAEAEELITRSVRIFSEARDAWWEEAGRDEGRIRPFCLGSVGPYGAYLADGSEYRGNYDVSDETLRIFHERRMELLWEAGADLLLIETQPSLGEALIAADIAEGLGADYWISFSCRDGRHIHEGDPVRDCAAALAKGHPRLKMIGVNCVPPQFVEPLIGEIKAACDLPVAVYPNSGEIYDPRTKTWHGSRDGMSFGDYALRWIRAGAKAVGGCCRTVGSHIREAARAREISEKMRLYRQG